MTALVPKWAWITFGVLTLGGLGAAVVLHARTPAYEILLNRAGVPKELHRFAAIQRYTESRGNPKAGLGRPELFPSWAEPSNASLELQFAESNAAERGYDNNAEAYAESPHPRHEWVFGSGGPYGLIPSSALAPFRRTDALRRGRVGPYDVFDPWLSTVMFVDFVWRLLQRAEFRQLPASDRNWYAIKRGMASPKLMADRDWEEARSRRSRSNARKAAEALGIPESYLLSPVPTEWPHYRGALELLS